jgi:hypothetical protein
MQILTLLKVSFDVNVPTSTLPLPAAELVVYVRVFLLPRVVFVAPVYENTSIGVVIDDDAVALVVFNAPVAVTVNVYEVLAVNPVTVYVVPLSEYDPPPLKT